MRTSQSPTPPAAPGTPAAAQTTAQNTATLVGQLTDLRVQEAGLRAQLDGLKRQLDGMMRNNPARPQVQAKHADVGVQLAQVQGDIARVQAQLQRQGVTVSTGATPPPMRNQQFDPDVAAGLMFAIIFAVLMPMSIAFARRVWRGKPAPPADTTIAPRLDRIEHAIDAIAIEVERVSEGQRFVTKILAERPAADVAQIRALGAGAAEPISTPEREAVRQRNT